MFPVLGRVASEGVVQVLPLRQISLHLLILLHDDLLIILVREIEAAAVTFKQLVVQEGVQTIHTAGWGRTGLLSLLLRCPFIISWPVFAFRVS